MLCASVRARGYRRLIVSCAQASDKYGDANESINPDDWEQWFNKNGRTKAAADDEEDEIENIAQAKSSWSIGSIFSGLTNRVQRAFFTPVMGRND